MVRAVFIHETPELPLNSLSLAFKSVHKKSVQHNLHLSLGRGTEVDQNQQQNHLYGEPDTFSPSPVHGTGAHLFQFLSQ